MFEPTCNPLLSPFTVAFAGLLHPGEPRVVNRAHGNISVAAPFDSQEPNPPTGKPIDVQRVEDPNRLVNLQTSNFDPNSHERIIPKPNP